MGGNLVSINTWWEV